ncbi:MAG: hypothetical protein LBU60_05565, partial [Clostridiales bacterium]|nr:hypothetical protein [Clostridiales bacterium]
RQYKSDRTGYKSKYDNQEFVANNKYNNRQICGEQIAKNYRSSDIGSNYQDRQDRQNRQNKNDRLRDKSKYSNQEFFTGNRYNNRQICDEQQVVKNGNINLERNVQSQTNVSRRGQDNYFEPCASTFNIATSRDRDETVKKPPVAPQAPSSTVTPTPAPTTPTPIPAPLPTPAN